MKQLSGFFSKHFVFILLFLITVGSFGLRSFRLNSAPYGAFIDESHFGYIAYSLLNTGADEHGQRWPLVFTGFGDQKLPAYGYALVPFVALFDLSVSTIRLPSALAGTINVVLLFWLVKRLSRSSEWGLVAAFITAVSPWPFVLSRFGFESNLALVFWLIALNCWIRVEHQWRWLLAGNLAAAATWYAYIAYRPITFLFVMGVTVFLWFQPKQVVSKRKTLGALAGFLVVVLPFLVSGMSGSNAARFNQVGLLADTSIPLTVNEQRTFCRSSLPTLICYPLYNRYAIYAQTLLTRYLNAFSPSYLGTFGETVERAVAVSGYGQFNVTLYPFFLVGLMYIVIANTRQLPKRFKWLIVLGMLVTPVPSILAGEPQKVRISALLPFVIVIIVLGLRWSFEKTKAVIPKNEAQTLVAAFAVLLFCFFSARFFVSFFTIQVDKEDFAYQSYVRDLMPFLDQQLAGGYTVYLKPTFSDPLMFYAFYTKMDPVLYQQQAVLGEKEKNGFQHTVALDRFYVTSDDLVSVACRVHTDSSPALYLSNERVKDNGIVYTARSRNGVLSYLYAYDIGELKKMYPGMCAGAQPKR